MNAEIISVIKRIGFLVILGAIYYWYYHEPVRDSSGSIIESGSINPIDLFSGDCYKEHKYISKDDDIWDQNDVTAVPCSSPHNNEVIAVLPKLFNANPELDTFDNMNEKCWIEANDYLGLENITTESADLFVNNYNMVVVFNPSWQSDLPDPDKRFACIISNNNNLTQSSVKNFFKP